MKKKLLFLAIFLVLLLGILSVNSYAAISVNSPTVNSGENVTISVTSSEALGAYKLTATSYTGLSFVTSSTSNGEANGTVISGSSTTGTTSLGSYTFKAPTVTTNSTYSVTISLTGAEKTDLTAVSNSSATATITVKAPVQPSPSVAPSPQPSPQPSKAPELTFTDKNETVYVTKDVNVRSNYGTSASSKIIGQLKPGDSIVRIGVSNEMADGNYWSKVKYNGETAYIASGFLTTVPPEISSTTATATASPDANDNKSHDSSLSELSFKGVELTPVFNSAITTYNANVKADVANVQVTAKANDTKSKVEITGDKDLKIGENIVTVTVTAEDETKTEYKIKIIKGAETIPMNAVVLTGIRENGQKIAITIEKPEIKDNKVTYDITIKEKLKSVEIIGTLDKEKYSYEGLGIFDLKDGDNEYKVTIKQTGGNDVDYILKINYSLDQAAATQSGSKINFKVVAIVVVVIVAIVGVFLFLRYKGKGKSDFGDTDYSFLRKDPPKTEDDIYKFDYNDTNKGGNDEISGRRSGKHF